MAEEIKTPGSDQQANTPTVEELMTQLAAERAEKERHKTALDKALKEKGDITKQLRAKQTEDEQAEEARKEAQRLADEERENLRKENNRFKALNAYKNLDEKTVDQLLDAVTNADHATIAAIISSQVEVAVKEAETKWLGDRPRVNADAGNYVGMSRNDILAIKDYEERQKAIAMNIDKFL